MLKAVAILFALSTVCAEMPGIWLDQPIINSKIVLGQDANEGEFPYMVSLRKIDRNNIHFCGGSILTKHWALTASHCCAVGTPDTIQIASGSIYLDQGATMHPVEKIIKHENYQPTNNWKNDVCLIRVSKPFEFSDNVNQITLPPQNWTVAHGERITASGWGYTSPTKPQQVPNRLQKANTFTALSNQACASEAWLVTMSEAYLCCRGARNQGVCNGDSGSPVTKDGVQVGVASFVFLPCGSGRPDFFARVPTYTDWIIKQLGSEAGELKIHK